MMCFVFELLSDFKRNEI